MLRRDDELRLSKETQARYAACGDSCTGKERVTKSIQLQVVREVGFVNGAEAEGLDLIRSAQSLFPDDVEITNAAFYLRHNIHMDCPLTVGERIRAASAIILHELGPGLQLGPLPSPANEAAAAIPLESVAAHLMPRSLSDILAQAEITVLCAGSHT